jgi:uncharacterized SAM-binding protein YcdF (DUF218 family)
MDAMVVSVLLFVAAVITAGLPVYVGPQIDPLRRADAIFVLGGNGYQRYPYALELALQGLAPRVVMSNPAGDRDIWLTDLCEQQRYKFPVSCFEPEPATTVGEARELRRLAIEQGWRTVIVVTFRPHISRARYILQQCFDGQFDYDRINSRTFSRILDVDLPLPDGWLRSRGIAAGMLIFLHR